jgi:succinoglycan biosynthesis protein ExoU
MRVSSKGVCVVIAAFKAKATIGRAVKSALAQDCVDEIIVCDDGSQDGTADAARLEDDGTGRLIVHELPRNVGPAAARNVAFAAARSPYICILDSDDYFLPGRVARLVNADVGEWDMIADDILIVPESHDATGTGVSRSEPPSHGMVLRLEPFVRANISRAGQSRKEWGFLKPLMRREFLTRHGLRYDESLRLGEDYAFYVRALIAGARFKVVDACGYVAIERTTSLSSRHTAEDLQAIAEFDARCLDSEAKLTSAERSAIGAHLDATRLKSTYRTILQIRKDQGFGPALVALLRVPSAWLYILAETLRAKTVVLLSRFGFEAQGGSSARLLIGARSIAREPDAGQRAEGRLHVSVGSGRT